MPIKSISKNCLYCKKQLRLVCTRDIERKKYCSRACQQKYRFSIGELDEQLKKMQKMANTPEANLKKSHKGENHPLYKKDRTKIKSPRPRYEQTEWKKFILKRDNYTCVHCGIVGGKLQVDHIKPYSLFPEVRWEISNGRTLCIPCHKKTPTYGRKLHKQKEFYDKK